MNGKDGPRFLAVGLWLKSRGAVLRRVGSGAFWRVSKWPVRPTAENHQSRWNGFPLIHQISLAIECWGFDSQHDDGLKVLIGRLGLDGQWGGRAGWGCGPPLS